MSTNTILFIIGITFIISGFGIQRFLLHKNLPDQPMTEEFSYSAADKKAAILGIILVVLGFICAMASFTLKYIIK